MAIIMHRKVEIASLVTFGTGCAVVGTWYSPDYFDSFTRMKKCSTLLCRYLCERGS